MRTAHQKYRRGRQLLAAVLAMAALALAGSVPAQAEADIERQAAAITASLRLPQIPQDRIFTGLRITVRFPMTGRMTARPFSRQWIMPHKQAGWFWYRPGIFIWPGR